MASLHVSLSDAMRTFIDERVQSGAYHNHSEYVRELIRKDQRRRTRERIDQLLVEGLQSGEPRALGPEDWQAIRDQVRERVGKRVAGGE